MTEIGNLPKALVSDAEFPPNMRAREAAIYSQVSESTLAKLRMRANRCKGPKFVKLSGTVIYRKRDLDQWIEQNLVDVAAS